MFKKILKDELIRGSLTLFVMIGVFNFLNYLQHFFMARMLGPEEYGLFAVLMAVTFIFTVPSEAIQTFVSRLISKFNQKKEFKKMKFVFSRTLNKGMKLALICFVMFVPIAIFLSYFLPHTTFFHLIFTGVIIFGVFSVPVIRGVLQGRKKFKKLGWSMIVESVFKLIISILLVSLGLKTYGAMAGVILGLFFSFLISLAFIKEVVIQKKSEIRIKSIQSSAIIVTMLIIAVMLSLDIILAKRLFSDELAGKYAVVSMLGKMIFFGVQPISKAMFPIASEDADKGRKKNKTFYKSMILITILCLISVTIFFIFPRLLIKVFFGQQYIEVSNLVGIVGLALSFLAIANLVLLYHLSLSRIKKPLLLIVFPILQCIFLLFFHRTIVQFSLALLFSDLIVLVFSLSILSKR